MEDVPLETVLSNLKRIANDVQTDHQADVGRQLRKCGYVVPENDRNPDGVMKVLTEAVTEAVTEAIRKVDLKKVDPENMENNDSKRLANLLGVDSLCGPNCFPQDVKKDKLFQKAESPRDMAEYLEKRADMVAANIIQKQFQIKWNTPTGVPAINHTFYQFCDTERTQEFFKYHPRRAHVEVTLYKECRTQSTSNVQKICKRNQQLCPKVYIKTAKGWKTWDADTKEFTDSRHNQFGWIHKSIKSFIEKNADEQRDDFNSLEESLKKPTLYWAVLEDEDFSSGENLKLDEISATQIYVGKTDRGIRKRWTGHCSKMKNCLDSVRAMTTYDPLKLKGISLVDARLALAKVRGERTALFVIKTFGDDVEKARLEIERYLHDSIQALSSDEDRTKLSSSKELKKLISFLDKTKVPLEKAAPTPKKNEAYMREANNYLDAIKNEYLITAEKDLKNLRNDLNENLAKTVEKVKTKLNAPKRSSAGTLLENAKKRHLSGEIELVLTGTDSNLSDASSTNKWKPQNLYHCH